MSEYKFPKLPDVINATVLRSKEGNYIIELVDFDVFTQANSREEIPFYINDLIYELFDVPKKAQNNVWYQPRKESPLTKVDKVPLPYHLLVSRELDNLLHS